MASKPKPILMRRVADSAKARHVGDFWWRVGEDGERTLQVLVPGKLADDQIIAECPIGADAWFWDGDADRPTLQPHVRCKSDAGEWRGHVTDGFLVPA